MRTYLQNINFNVEDNSWGSNENYHLEGTMKIGIESDLSGLFDNSVTVNTAITVKLNELPKEMQENLINIYNDIQKFITKNNADTLTPVHINHTIPETRIPNGTIVIETKTGRELKIVDAIISDNRFNYGLYLYRFEGLLDTGFGLYRNEIKISI